jgi:hypothetical protein
MTIPTDDVFLFFCGGEKHQIATNGAFDNQEKVGLIFRVASNQQESANMGFGPILGIFHNRGSQLIIQILGRFAHENHGEKAKETHVLSSSCRF